MMVRRVGRRLVALAVLAVLLTGLSSASPSGAAPVSRRVGEVTRFPLPPGQFAGSITTGPDGNLWFVALAGIGRMTPAGSVTIFPLPRKSRPTVIAPGPDGALWFTDQGLNWIGRVSPTGDITHFRIPQKNASPYGITAGPDGNVWFTETRRSRIGRLTTTGQFSAFHTLRIGAHPFNITTGPDGNLWFAEPAVGIGRVTPAGAMTDFPLNFIHAYDITVGSDGRLWFIGRKQGSSISTDGHFGTLFGVQKHHSGYLRSIASGADGALWVTVGRYSRIVRVTTGIDEHIFRHLEPRPNDITAGPDGNLWFTGGDSIWRITDAPAPAVGVDPAQGAPSTPFDVTGTLFGSFEPVHLLFVDSTGARWDLGRTRTDANGRFRKPVTVPSGAQPGTAHVTVKGHTSGLKVVEAFEVT